MVADGERGTTAGWYGAGISACRLHRYEALQTTRGSETLHRPLSFSKREVAVFCSVIEPLVRPMIKARRDLAQAQVEPDVEPDNTSDDLRRKPVALVADFRCLHQNPLRQDQCTSNFAPVNVTTPASDRVRLCELTGQISVLTQLLS